MQEIDQRFDFDNWLALGEARKPAAIQAVDLTSLAVEALMGSFEGSLFLGCLIPDPAVSAQLVSMGAVLLPNLPGYEFVVHRSGLYRVSELFEGFDLLDPAGYEGTRDYRIYAQFLKQGGAMPPSIQTTLARRLHDHSITDALMEIIEGRKVVAIMGGHSMARGDAFYASVARIARSLTRRGYLMVSGGGPGAMEATHLGAYFAARPDSDLQRAIEILKVRPAGATGGEYADSDWLHRAWRVLEAFPIEPGTEDQCLSVGVPTWLYGHEPPAPFATRIAKYFANSVREDGLLAIATHGVVFAPGSAGTTQEVFQDAAQNHYFTAGSCSPMILLGREHWTQTRPVWPLLEQVSRGQLYGELVALTDDEETVIRQIQAYEPARYQKPG